MPAPVGSRKFWAYIAFLGTLIVLAGVSTWKLTGSALAGVLTSLGSTAMMGLAAFVGGNFGEHWSKRSGAESTNKTKDAPSEEAALSEDEGEG